MWCWMSLTRVITSIQTSLKGSPECQVIKLVSSMDFAGVLMKIDKQANKKPKPTNENKIKPHNKES